MNTKPLETTSEQPDSDTINENAINAPKTLFEASTASGSAYTRAPGLILTKNEILALKKYELAGLALPTTLEHVIAYLGYETGAGPGLEAKDFQESFKIVHNHASRWRPLQTKLRSVSSELKAFAGDMLIYGESMLDLQKEIKAGKFVEEHDIKTVEDLDRIKQEWGDKFPGIELEGSEAHEFRSYLDRILKAVREKHEQAYDIKEELDSFGEDLAIHVLPTIRRKVKAIDSSPLPGEISKLNADIEKRAQDIDEKIAEYKKSVETSLGSLSKANVFGLALSIYHGVEAENVRAARNDLMAQQASDIDLLRQKNTVLGTLQRVKYDLQNLDTIVIDADIATQNLITVWNSLALYAEKSAKHTDTVKDALSLNLFMTDFRLVVAPWKNIQEDAHKLHDVFQDADNEFKRINGQ